MKRIGYLVIIIVGLLFFISESQAQVPMQIAHQGRLTDATGNPITNSAQSIAFSIYDVATGGSLLWQETQSVNVSNGLYSVLLGTVTPFPSNLFTGSPRFLAIKVGGDAEMTPRQRLVSVPFSINSSKAMEAGTVADGTITSTKIADGTITGADISNNSIGADKIIPNIVSSIDGITNDAGNIDLVPGTGITIASDINAKTVTISATGGVGGSTSDVVCTGCVQSSDIADGTIVGADISTGANVTLNGLTLGAGTSEGSINRIDTLEGFNDLRIRGDNVSGSTDFSDLYIDASGNVQIFNGDLTLGTSTAARNFVVNGKVGVGLTNPGAKLAVNNPTTSGKIGSSGDGIYAFANSLNSAIAAEQANTNGLAIFASGKVRFEGNSPGDEILTLVRIGAANPTIFKVGQDSAFLIRNNNSDAMIFKAGNVGIGTTSPDLRLSVNGNASKVGGGSWAVFSDDRLKTINGDFKYGLSEVLKLKPILYRYSGDNPLGIPDEGQHVGFSAQEVQEIIPEAVTENSKGYRMLNNDPILWAMLNAIKEQQKEIEKLKEKILQLETQ